MNLNSGFFILPNKNMLHWIEFYLFIKVHLSYHISKFIQFNRTLIIITMSKDIYNRSTKSGAFCALQLMSFNPLPFYATQIITSFPNSMISANYDKGLGF